MSWNQGKFPLPGEEMGELFEAFPEKEEINELESFWDLMNYIDIS